MELYQTVADWSLTSALTKYSVKEYWLRAAMCSMAMGVSLDPVSIMSPIPTLPLPSHVQSPFTMPLRSEQKVVVRVKLRMTWTDHQPTLNPHRTSSRPKDYLPPSLKKTSPFPQQEKPNSQLNSWTRVNKVTWRDSPLRSTVMIKSRNWIIGRLGFC